MTSPMAVGSGLVSGQTNMKNDFTVYHHGRGYGGLSVQMEGPTRANIQYSDNHDGSVKVQYTPYAPGEYKCTVRYDGIHVRGSPFTIRIRGEDVSSIRTSSHVQELMGDTRSSSRTGSPFITDRGDRMSDLMHDMVSEMRSEMGMSYSPTSTSRPSSRTSGTSSPRPGSGLRVRVTGRGLYSGITNVMNEVTVDVRDAGSGRLHWSIEGPGSVESKNAGLTDGMYRLYYKPNRPGDYTITIRYNNLEVIGSPYKVHVL